MWRKRKIFRIRRISGKVACSRLQSINQTLEPFFVIKTIFLRRQKLVFHFSNNLLFYCSWKYERQRCFNCSMCSMTRVCDWACQRLHYVERQILVEINLSTRPLLWHQYADAAFCSADQSLCECLRSTATVSSKKCPEPNCLYPFESQFSFYEVEVVVACVKSYSNKFVSRFFFFLFLRACWIHV